MKYVVIALLVVHGLITLLGFVKAFDLFPVTQLQTPVSQTAGILWLAAALLLIGSGIALLFGSQWWWVPAALGVVLSQILIFGDWGDAKAGTIANVILLVPIVVAALGSAPWGFRARFEHDVTEGLHQQVAAPKLVTEADIANLPAAVQRYLVFAGAVGKPLVWNYRMRFGGTLRNGPDDKWMPMVAHQQSFVSPPARLFLVEGAMLGVPFDAYHRYVGPAATFQVRAASLVTMVDAHGAEMNHSETVTLFNDMFLLAPATLIAPEITWEELDPFTVRATWTNAGNTVSAVVSFDRTGAITNFVSDERSRTVDGKHYERLRWSTPVSGWHDVDGRKLFGSGEAAWELDGKEFTYARFELLDVEYNVAQC
ncbi:MAG: DUF6544 family protein [Caldilineaceae bacterium]